MKLTLKLVLVVLAVTVFVLSIAGYLRVQREVETFQHNMAQDGFLLGQLLRVYFARGAVLRRHELYG